MRRPSNLMTTILAPEPEPPPAAPAAPANYLDLYGLSKPPFGDAGENGSFILFGSHRRALELVSQHVTNGTGVILLQGDEGVGKSEALRAAAAIAAESGLRAVSVSRPTDGRVSLMQLVSALEGHPNANPATAEEAILRFLTSPRKVLLADDLDLMPAECVRLLLALVQRIPADSPGPAIVLSTTNMLTADPSRPELTQLAGLARDTIRMPRLNSGEMRQYIERSLWVAGGTTRRLISPDALKILVTRSGGLPGIANRLMEAALTAGFARGDSMITARTVAAATGPTAPRPRYREPASPGNAGRVVQLVAVGLLIAGASAFLYRGLTGSVDHPAPQLIASPRPPNTTHQQPKPNVKPAEVMSPDLVAALMKRGDQLFGLGDISAARLLYQRAAEAGNAPAATALGKTYDPNFTPPGGNPDQARAAQWYQRALTLGDPQAADLLKRIAPHRS